MENNSMSAMFLSSSVFLDELMFISKDIVWKNTFLANRSEDPEYYVEAELFVAANKGLITFDNIFQLDLLILREMGLSDNMINSCMDNKYALSVSQRDSYMDLFIKRMMEKDSVTGHYKYYVEYNNYYRMLAGLPDVNDNDFIYNDRFDDMSKTTPIHLLPLTDRYNIEQTGYLNELINRYPDKKYLKHIASKSIDFYIARISDKFAILYMNPSEYENLVSDFREVYNNSRYQIIKVYYNDIYRKTSEQYEGFMAMCVLFMTVQTMHYKYLDVDITRDFYDLESIRYIYDSYSVPFFRSIHLQYHKKIVKNINRIISYKGSTRVFFDLFELFNYGHMDVYEYYLLKTHRFGPDGVPIFQDKPDGTPDYEAMYDIKFGKVRLYDDPPLELSDTSNHVDYTTMTILDPYWVSDHALLDKIYREDYNYLETKYIGIQTVFDMMKIIYEEAYFIQMIVSNKQALSRTSVFYNNINANVNIFDLIIYLSAMICQKYGYEGNISTNLPSVSKILGFNFKDLVTIIQNHIRSDEILAADDELNQLLLDMNVNSILSVNTTFRKINNIRFHITDKITTAENRKAYFAYYNLQKALMSTQIVENLYKKRNGETAESFKDLLGDLNGPLYIRLLAPDLDIDMEIDTVLVLFTNICTELRYFESVDGMDIGAIIQHLFTVLSFFKSAKAELTGYNITYMISSRGLNTLKFFAEINKVIEGKIFVDSEIQMMTDLIRGIADFNRIKNRLQLYRDQVTMQHHKYYFESQIEFIDRILGLSAHFIKLHPDHALFTDELTNYLTTYFYRDNLTITDKNNLAIIHDRIFYEDNEIDIKDQLVLLEKFISYNELIHEPLKSGIDNLFAIIKQVYDNQSLRNDLLLHDKFMEVVNNIKMISKLTLQDEIISTNDNSNIDSILHMESIIKGIDELISPKKIDLSFNDKIHSSDINRKESSYILDDKVQSINDKSTLKSILLNHLTCELSNIVEQVYVHSDMRLIDGINIIHQNNRNNDLMLFKDRLTVISDKVIN